jgi:ABC-type nitrate/sulfonate/bicarbonate transport system permease component
MMRRIEFKQLPVLPSLITLGVLVILWELIVQATSANFRIIPPPTAIWTAFLRTWSSLAQDIPVTLLETFIGMGIAVVLGLGAAAALDFIPLLKRAVYPLLIISQTIPTVAVAAVLIITFGFDIWPKVIVVVLFCFFPITVATIDGLAATDPDLLALLRAMGATRMQVWRKVRFPAATPAFFSGLKIAATYSITGAIVGEYITAQFGLGRYLRSAFSQGKNDQAFVAIVITSLLSIAIVGVVTLLERFFLPWFYTSARKAQWTEPGIY